MEAPEKNRFIKNNFLLFVILAVAAILRFYNLGEASLTNDELSALVRTEFGSFGELIERGVRVDAHPAGVQVFEYYWVRLAGRSEFALRFPFAVAGVLSVFFLYLVGRQWFGKINGLLAASALAVLQFPLLYSQIARPYAPGLLFTLSATYFWSLLLFETGEKHGRSKTAGSAAGFILSLAGCAYTHYFSMLTGGILAVSGLLFLNKRNFRIYLISCLCSMILFLPHLPIFFRQLSYGGVGEWLGVPKSGFLGRYVDYCLNDSLWIKLLALALCMVPFLVFTGRLKKPAFYLLCIAWFLLPYAIGYWYSAKINPVLQYSTLLFSYPFLLLFFTGFVPDDKISASVRIALVCMLLAVGTVSTVAEKKYYSTRHFGVFKELASNLLEWNRAYGAGQLTTVLNVTNPAYVGYYFDKYRFHPAVSMYYVADESSLARLRDVVDSSRSGYFVYGWSNMTHYFEAVDLVREKYPVAVEQRPYFNSTISLYGNQGVAPKEKPLFYTGTSFENNLWNDEENRRSDEMAHTGMYSENMEGKEYGLTFSRQLKDLTAGRDAVISFSAWFLTPAPASDGNLVLSFEGQGKTYLYAATPVKAYNRRPGTWQKIILSKQVPEGMPPTGEVKMYFWNPGKGKVFADDLSVTVRDSSYYR